MPRRNLPREERKPYAKKARHRGLLRFNKRVREDKHHKPVSPIETYDEP